MIAALIRRSIANRFLVLAAAVLLAAAGLWSAARTPVGVSWPVTCTQAPVARSAALPFVNLAWLPSTMVPRSVKLASDT